MAGKSDDAGFRARVHEGHLLNFIRKVNSADSESALLRLRQTIGSAIDLGMLIPEDRQILEDYIRQREDELYC